MDGSARADSVRRLIEAMEGAHQADRQRVADEVDALFASVQDRAYYVCHRWVRDPQRARELAQETMLIAWQKIPELRGDTPFQAWIYGIARNLSRRAAARRRDLLSHDGVLDGTDASPPVLRQMRRQEREALLVEASAAVLDPLEQEAVYLRYVEQLPQDTITEVLGLTGPGQESGARGILQRCRRKLGRELRRRLDELGHGSSFFASSLSP